MRTFLDILKFVLEYKGFAKERDVANWLGVEPNTLSSWKKRNKIPYDLLIAKCEQENINTGLLFLGKMEVSNYENVIINEMSLLSKKEKYLVLEGVREKIFWLRHRRERKEVPPERKPGVS